MLLFKTFKEFPIALRLKPKHPRRPTFSCSFQPYLLSYIPFVVGPSLTLSLSRLFHFSLRFLSFLVFTSVWNPLPIGLLMSFSDLRSLSSPLKYLCQYHLFQYTLCMCLHIICHCHSLISDSQESYGCAGGLLGDITLWTETNVLFKCSER